MTISSNKSNAQGAATNAQANSPLTGPGSVLQCKQQSSTRSIGGIVMKRKHIDLFGEDPYGHWWFEIDGAESYGWWPAESVDVEKTFRGVPGELNGVTNFSGGTATTDPHHGDPAEEMFSPVVPVSDTRTDEQIKDCLRQFARSYSGQWQWVFGSGQNCHTFQKAAMKHCGLSQP